MKRKSIFSKVLTAVMLSAAVSLLSACFEAEDNAIWWSDVMMIHGDGVADNATTLEIGQTLQLTAEPADKGLVWNSSNEQVATVSADGQVTAAGLGEAIITVYPQEYEHVGNGNYVVVTVVDSSIPFADDQIDQEEAE